MNYPMRGVILFVVVLLITVLVPIFGCPSSGDGQSNLANRVSALEAALATTQANLSAANAKLAYMSVEQGVLEGLNGPHLIIEGCNVHVRSGSGETADAAGLTGLGNVVIGYNEPPEAVVYGRTGSHNLVVGMNHEYNNFGGLVAGENNDVIGQAASAGGGFGHTASGTYAAVSGGAFNSASANSSCVSGGRFNAASAGGSSVSGGMNNQATGIGASVGGGSNNTAAGQTSSVSGGSGRTAANLNDWVAGALTQDF